MTFILIVGSDSIGRNSVMMNSNLRDTSHRNEHELVA